jgi:hypothetical protein
LEETFDALQRISFKLTPGFDRHKVEELVKVSRRVTEFPPSMKKGRLRHGDSDRSAQVRGIPNWVFARLTAECGGTVHNRTVVEVTSSMVMVNA